jgi:hypothetical protein
MHKVLRLYKNGKWQGNPDRTIVLDGVKHNLDEWAENNNIDLPDAKKHKKQVNTKKDKDLKEKSYGSMEQEHHEGHLKESGE